MSSYLFFSGNSSPQTALSSLRSVTYSNIYNHFLQSSTSSVDQVFAGIPELDASHITLLWHKCIGILPPTHDEEASLPSRTLERALYQPRFSDLMKALVPNARIFSNIYPHPKTKCPDFSCWPDNTVLSWSQTRWNCEIERSCSGHCLTEGGGQAVNFVADTVLYSYPDRVFALSFLTDTRSIIFYRLNYEDEQGAFQFSFLFLFLVVVFVSRSPCSFSLQSFLFID